MRPLMQPIYSSRTADKFVLRLPDGMRERVATVARKHHRSMNSEIIVRIDASMEDEKRIADIDPNTVTLHERCLLDSFRKLGKAKQQALLLLCTADDADADAVE